MDNFNVNSNTGRKRNAAQTYVILIIVGLIIAAAVLFFVTSGNGIKKASDPTESSGKSGEQAVGGSPVGEVERLHQTTVIDGITYIDGIMIVNKTYSIPADYDPGQLNEVASTAFDTMASDAAMDGINLYIISGYRSYARQEELYNGYVNDRGIEVADSVSSRPGHSEHQTGLCMDVNTTEFSFEGTPEAVWLEEHCAEYGFIIRFPKGKEDMTGYAYEPWHIRYVGFQAAQEIMSQGICLEEYLDVTSSYDDCKDVE